MSTIQRVSDIQAVDDYDDFPAATRHPLRSPAVLAVLGAFLAAAVLIAFLTGYGLGYQSGYVDGEVAVTNPH